MTHVENSFSNRRGSKRNDIRLSTINRPRGEKKRKEKKRREEKKKVIKKCVESDDMGYFASPRGKKEKKKKKKKKRATTRRVRANLIRTLKGTNEMLSTGILTRSYPRPPISSTTKNWPTCKEDY